MTVPRLSNISVLLATLAILASCDNGCEQDRESFVHLSFTSMSGRVLKSLSHLATSDVTDLCVESTGITSFDDVEIDLDPHGSQSVIILTMTYTDYGDSYTVKDTLQIRYTTTPEFLDMSCGCTMQYHIDEVKALTHNLLTQVTLSDAVVTPTSSNNISFEY